MAVAAAGGGGVPWASAAGGDVPFGAAGGASDSEGACCMSRAVGPVGGGC